MSLPTLSTLKQARREAKLHLRGSEITHQLIPNQIKFLPKDEIDALLERLSAKAESNRKLVKRYMLIIATTSLLIAIKVYEPNRDISLQGFRLFQIESIGIVLFAWNVLLFSLLGGIARRSALIESTILGICRYVEPKSSNIVALSYGAIDSQKIERLIIEKSESIGGIFTTLSFKIIYSIEKLLSIIMAPILLFPIFINYAFLSKNPFLGFEYHIIWKSISWILFLGQIGSVMLLAVSVGVFSLENRSKE